MSSYSYTSNKPYEEIEGKLHFQFDKQYDISEVLKKFTGGNWNEYPITLGRSNTVPSGKGVYLFVITDTITKIDTVAYVGRSINLNMRLYSHPILRFLFCMLADKYNLSLLVNKTDLYLDYEWKLIEQFDPFLNSEYNKRHHRNFKFIFPKKMKNR